MVETGHVFRDENNVFTMADHQSEQSEYNASRPASKKWTGTINKFEN